VASLEKITTASQDNSQRLEPPIEVPQKRQLFIRSHNETFAVVAVSVSNPEERLESAVPRKL